ncbi:MAG: type II toxin-antitoxin system HicB family antitoxin [Bacteroidetes bacterium]|nr:type II toxin-antitoxin system HicB family antitoxin [Bacteroidota bacterium]
MNKYLIIIEKTKTGYSAYSPDVPGCIATGNTKKSTEENMKEALEFHIEGLLEEGMEIPNSMVKYAEFVSLKLNKKPKKDLVIA